MNRYIIRVYYQGLYQKLVLLGYNPFFLSKRCYVACLFYLSWCRFKHEVAVKGVPAPL